MTSGFCPLTLIKFQCKQDYGDKWLQCGHNIYRQTRIQCWGPMPLWYIWVEWTQLKMVLIEQAVQLRLLSTVRTLLRWWQRWKSRLHVFSQAENDQQINSQCLNDIMTYPIISYGMPKKLCKACSVFGWVYIMLMTAKWNIIRIRK